MKTQKVKIVPQEWYTPGQLAESGLTGTPTVSSARYIILRYIRGGKLPAKNINNGEGRQARYFVLGADFITFINTKQKYAKPRN